MSEKTESLSLFHPLIARWFAEEVGVPTEVQYRSWPKIAEGHHVLITAPTGSGKTLAAFLWAINKLAVGAWSAGHTRVLYISPLKALNNDIHRNLILPLSELHEVFVKAKEAFPQIRVRTRSGDTPEADRRAMLRNPPEILITTPESLNLLLSSRGGRTLLTGLTSVILDEIHAVVGTKRGTHLITAVDRLVLLSGEFQRIALSATVGPMETVAHYVGGFRLEGNGHDPRYIPRPVTKLSSRMPKTYDIQIHFPQPDHPAQSRESVWEFIVGEVKKRVKANRTTLIFVNSRRFCEKLTLKINDGEEHLLAYAHHGSLSREIRQAVEEKLRVGDLKAIVATHSLELGIDIGLLDEVVLFQSPSTISSAIQRIGRAGHGVGQVSRGIFFPTHGQDLLEAAALAPCILAQDLEGVNPVECPLDVLAQVVISMTGLETWDMDELYAFLKTSAPYRHLSRKQFDLVLNMLAGRYANTRIRELRQRISLDRLDNTIAAKKGALLNLYMSGGTIPDRGYFHLRHYKTGGLIGELDEEFVWEATVGETFTLGTQHWRIESITHNDVLVRPAVPKFRSAPFWKGEENNRDFHFSSKIAQFLEGVNHRLDDPDLVRTLVEGHFLENSAAQAIIDFLKSQKEKTHCDLPHRHHLLIERVSSGPGAVPGNQLILHTFWGGRVNRPFAIALDAAWEKQYGHRLEIYAGNDCIAMLLPHEISGADLLTLVSLHHLEDSIRTRLEATGFFGARFRECAGRALLITRNSIRERMPLWMNRLRSQKILDAVSRHAEFPILLEAWRTCFQDEFDMVSLRHVLGELESGIIKWSEAKTTSPSPMAGAIAWRQMNEYMYRGDEPLSSRPSSLRGDLIREVAHTPGLRPVIPAVVAEGFEKKRHRLSSGYSPASERELLDWIKERVIIQEKEWHQLLKAMERDHGDCSQEWVGALGEKIVWMQPKRAPAPMIISIERLGEVIPSFYGTLETPQVKALSGGFNASDALSTDDIQIDSESDDGRFTTLLGEWLSFYGPLEPDVMCHNLGLDRDRITPVLEDLIATGTVIAGTLIKDGPEAICDGENFERLMRLARAHGLPHLEALDADVLPLFIAFWQGITAGDSGEPNKDIDRLQQAMERLLCCSQPVSHWESEILPARFPRYDPSWLDISIQESDLRWIGMEKQRILFCFDTDLDLLIEETEEKEGVAIHGDEMDTLLPETKGRYDFSTLLGITGLRPAELSKQLWRLFWEGQATHDAFGAIRRGIENRFQVPQVADNAWGRRSGRYRSGGRSAFSKWKSTLPYGGNWFRLSWPEISMDPVEREERNKDRVRILFHRYGVLFRGLLLREIPAFQWHQLFRTLRIMELSGEILGGYFFHDLGGPQFISHEAFRMLQKNLPKEKIWWVHATDPASLCGVPVDALKGGLPQRREGTHLVYHGKRLVMVSEGKGRRLNFHCSHENVNLAGYMAPLHHLLNRSFQSLRKITVEIINGEKGPQSPYLDALRTAFDVIVDHKQITLYRNKG
jgi:ATP-dependent Lhr-like helicase